MKFTFSSPAVHLLFAFFTWSFLAVTPAARADEREAVAKVTDLNKQAITAYENLELEEARNLLMQALQVCASEGLSTHPMKARTHVHLGVILAGGFQEKDKALAQFKKALELQPSITVTGALSNPEIDGIFKQAQAEAPKGDVTETKPDEPAEVVEVPPPPPAGGNFDGPPADVTGIFHEPVASAKVGERIEIRVAVQADLEFQRLVLAYRPENASGFLAREMEKEESGWWSARIPEPATQGKLVHYYIEARDKTGQPVATNGSADEAHLIALGKAAVVVDDSDLVADESDDEMPGALRSEAGGKRWMLGFMVGSGYGVADGKPELTPFTDEDPQKGITFSGSAPSGTVVLLPEVGYFLSPKFLLSVQLRWQILTGLTPAKQADSDTLYQPAKGAISGFVRGTYFFGEPTRLRPYLSGAIGGGEIRHVIDIGNLNSTCGDAPDGEVGTEACIDSVLSGPVFVGPGAGLLLPLGPTFGIFAGVNSLIGFPNFTANFDFGLGISAGL